MKNVSAATPFISRYFNGLLQDRPYLQNKILNPIFLLIAVLISSFLFSQPTITSFSPISALPGSTLTIRGNGFGNTPSENIVTVGGTPATVLTASPTQLTVRVPKALNDQPITVTAGNRTGRSAVPFRLTYKGGFIAPGSFATSVAISPDVYGEIFSSVIYDDLDGDGKQDLFVPGVQIRHWPSELYSSWSVFRNTSTPGHISFAKEISYNRSIPFDNGFVFLADVDCDAKKDVIFSSDDSDIVIYLNNSRPGNISFQAGVRIAKPLNPTWSWLNIEDVTGDGKPDLCIGKKTYLENTSTKGHVSFSQEMILPVTVEPYFYYDFNSDGKTDIYGFSEVSPVVHINSSSNGKVSYLGAVFPFDSHQYFLTGIADINKDGKLDLILIGTNSSNWYYSLNKSEGIILGFTSPQQFNLFPFPGYIPSADLDGDGKTDLIWYSDSAKGLIILKNTYAGNKINFASPVKVPELNNDYPIFADVDGDGKTDITYFRTDGELSYIRILRNQADTATGSPVITSFAPRSGTTNDTITIKGNNFYGTTSISFGDAGAASFVINSNTEIKAVVGEGNSGLLNVTNAKGTATKARFTYSRDTSARIVTLAPEVICENAFIHINAYTNNAGGPGTVVFYTWYKNGIEQEEKSKYLDLKNLKNNDSIWVVIRFSNQPEAKTFKSNVLRFTVNPVRPIISIQADRGTTICKGLPVTFKASVTNGKFIPVYRWQKNNIEVGDSTDTYTDDSLQNNDRITCTMISAQLCTIIPARTSIKMKVYDGPPVAPSSIIGPDVIAASQQGIIFSVRPARGASSYKWLIPQGASFVSSNNTDSVAVNWISTTAKISVIALNVCGKSAVTTKVVRVETNNNRIAQTDNTQTADVQDFLRVYPNPASNTATILFSSKADGPSVIEVKDIGGRVLLSKKIQSQKGTFKTDLNVSGLPPGAYFIVVTDKTNNRRSTRLVIGK